jgi:hypothetical protein
MFKAIKNTWTLAVNLGWIVVLGVVALPYIYNTAPPPKASSTTVETPKDVEPARPLPIAETPTPIIRKPVVTTKAKLVLVVPARPKLGKANKSVDPPLEPREEPKPDPNPAATAEEALALARAQLLASVPQDFPPTFGGRPTVICEGGFCRIDPRYKYTTDEQRMGPEPIIDFPDMPLPDVPLRPETARFSKARYSNKEMRSSLNQFKAKLKWTPKVMLYLDLSDMGACPWDEEKIFDQNWEIKWRLRQLGLMTQGYETEGEEVPERPRGKAGYIGVYPGQN